MYAIVDIETTGGNAGTGSITEIAILISDGKSVMHKYTPLVNPMQPIPVFIEKLTGITDKMVSIHSFPTRHSSDHRKSVV